MTIWQIILSFVGAIGGLGFLSFGAGYFMSQFRKGGKEDKISIAESAEKLTNFWKEQADGYKAMMGQKDEKYQAQINALTKEVGELRGQLTEKTTSYERLEKIFQGRNPEQERFINMMTAVSNQAQVFMENESKNSLEVARILSEIHTAVMNEHKKS